MDVGDIPKRWEELSGSTNWKGLIEPLDNDLRRYLIQYGEKVVAAYEAFNLEVASKNAGSCRYDKKDLFSRLGIVKGNRPFEYDIVKYFYATSQVSVPEAFILKPLSREAWSKESNWMGYIAVATDKGKAALGRRDILVAWRGSIQPYEWITDFRLVPSGKLFGDAGTVGIHEGWLSIYTSDDPKSPFVKTSARDQVISELQRLMKLYKDEEISITIAGHSMGAALATLNAADIVANNINKHQDESKNKKPYPPVTAFVFASPRVGSLGFWELVRRLDQLHILRVTNVRDRVPTMPSTTRGYMDVGEELRVDSLQSNYLNRPGDSKVWHDLEVYLHIVVGTHGDKEEFKLDSMERDIALVNKHKSALKRELLVPENWWCEKNKGMVQNSDGTWQLEDELHLDTIGE